jgi:hypothetical protein
MQHVPDADSPYRVVDHVAREAEQRRVPYADLRAQCAPQLTAQYQAMFASNSVMTQVFAPVFAAAVHQAATHCWETTDHVRLADVLAAVENLRGYGIGEPQKLLLAKPRLVGPRQPVAVPLPLFRSEL